MKIGYTTFSEAGVRRTNQNVCRVVEMSTIGNRRLLLFSHLQ